jgi:hypothetical protein
MVPEWNAILYRLLDASFRVAAFAVMVALILAAVRVRSNRVRHAAWTTVLSAMLLMPVLPYVLPSVRIAFPISVIRDQVRIPKASALPAAVSGSNFARERIWGFSLEAIPVPGHERGPAWPLARLDIATLKLTRLVDSGTTVSVDIARDGLFDIITMFYSSDFVGGTPQEFKGSLFENQQALINQAPATYASNFKTPMLVVHGGNDYRVDQSQGFAMFQALQAKHVPSKLLFFENENHWVLKPADSILWYHTVLDWLEEWVKPDRAEYERRLQAAAAATAR